MTDRELLELLHEARGSLMDAESALNRIIGLRWPDQLQHAEAILSLRLEIQAVRRQADTFARAIKATLL